MKQTCTTPETPEFYRDCLKKDIRLVFENAASNLVKCESYSEEFDFYFSIIEKYKHYEEQQF